jgi:predicted component of viral defense system (DUF524 family)
VAISSVQLKLVGPEGDVVGRITITPVAKQESEPPLLLDLTDFPDQSPELERIQLLEGAEYRYRVEGIDEAFVIDPDLFSPDPDDHRSGRLRPGLATGSVSVRLWRPPSGENESSELIGQAALEVRSRKLTYLQEYRRMLEDLTDWFTELVMERFAPSELSFRIDQTREPATLYQRFAFIRSLIDTEPCEAAIRQILSRPHRQWVEDLEPHRPGLPIPPSSAVARQLASPGRRVEWAGAPLGHPLQTVPATIMVPRTVESLDTPENRFVRFVLERWQELLLQVHDRLSAEKASSPVVRGIREVEALLAKIASWLAAPLFDEVGHLTIIPSNSQVLQKRTGYRDLFRAFIQVEAAATLSWRGDDDLFKAGQRDVATLYEVWVLYQVATLIARATETPWDGSSLLVVGENELGVHLKGGEAPILKGTIERLGRKMAIELYYNRTFARDREQSWSRPMRPDLSLWIGPVEGSPAPFEPVWIHFDAKYRVESITKLFGDSDQSEVVKETEEERQGKTRRADLLKMHAYRDAIRRSAGAYVIYPGSAVEKNPQYHELLPGLGAFPLRPSSADTAAGTEELGKFIEDLLTHIASQASQHERSRHWEREIYSARLTSPTPAAHFLERPPADTRVLVGWVKGDPPGAHLEWILKERLYNLRADNRTGQVQLGSPELEAEWILLYGSQMPPRLFRITGLPLVMTKQRLKDSGYPGPGGDLYLCLPIGTEEISFPWPRDATGRLVDLQGREKRTAPVGTPYVTSWLTISQQLWS